MDLQKLKEIMKNEPEKCSVMVKAKVDWPTYKQVKRHSKLVRRVLCKLFNGRLVECKHYISCGDLRGLPVLIAKE